MSDQDQVEQLQLFYTQDEVDNKVREALISAQKSTDSAIQSAITARMKWLSQDTLSALRGLLSDEVIDREQGTAVYNAIAEVAGWNTIDKLTRLFNVTVYYQNKSIGEFSDVEADDEDSAKDDVLENMEVEASISFSISYNNDSIDGEVDIDSMYDLDTDSFTAEVEEA